MNSLSGVSLLSGKRWGSRSFLSFFFVSGGDDRAEENGRPVPMDCARVRFASHFDNIYCAVTRNIYLSVFMYVFLSFFSFFFLGCKGKDETKQDTKYI
jgi:hypothetical protein